MNAIYCDLPCCQKYGIYEFSLLKYSLKYRSMIYPYQKLLPLEFENDIDNNKYLFENYNTLGPLHSMLCEGVEFTSKNQFPVVEPYTGELPENLCSIHRLRKKPDSLLRVICAHFFTDDSNIEPYWNNPFKYLRFLQRLGWIISTDLSLYTNMLLMQMLWNSFRNKLLSAFYQRNGIRLIPAPSWGDLPHIELFMEGWPKGSVIAINSTGIGLDKRCRYIWLEGYHAMLDILKPIHIMRYGAYIEGERKEMSTYYPNNNKAGYRYGR